MCNFWFRTEERFLYVRHPWNSPACLLVYRLIAFCITTQALVSHFMSRGSDWKFSFVYLTIQNTLMAAYAFFGLTCAYMCQCFRYKHCWRSIHAVFELAIVGSIPICLLYWGALYPAVKDDEQFWKVNDFFVEVELHSVIMLLLIIEYYLNGLYFYNTHVFFCLFYSLGYLLFNWYYTTQVRQIYTIMTWKDAETFIWAGLGLVLNILTFYFLLWWGKNKRGMEDEHETRALRQKGHRSSDIY